MDDCLLKSFYDEVRQNLRLLIEKVRDASIIYFGTMSYEVRVLHYQS